jgi:Putative transposase of IS4/5 family (DUF4096)
VRRTFQTVSLETTWKCSARMIVAYAARHGEQEIPTDLSDDEWRCIGPHLPGPAGWGRPRLHGLRAILVAVFYILVSGCPWRPLPRGTSCPGRPSR